MQVKYRNCENC